MTTKAGASRNQQLRPVSSTQKASNTYARVNGTAGTIETNIKTSKVNDPHQRSTLLLSPQQASQDVLVGAALKQPPVTPKQEKFYNSQRLGQS